MYLPPSRPTPDDDPHATKSLSVRLVFFRLCVLDLSLIGGMPALERERCMMSLMVQCRGILPKPREQDNPWLPLESIRVQKAHMCGSHIATQRRKPTATRTSSSSSLSPHAVTGNV